MEICELPAEATFRIKEVWEQNEKKHRLSFHKCEMVIFPQNALRPFGPRACSTPPAQIWRHLKLTKWESPFVGHVLAKSLFIHGKICASKFTNASICIAQKVKFLELINNFQASITKTWKANFFFFNLCLQLYILEGSVSHTLGWWSNKKYLYFSLSGRKRLDIW